MTVECGQCGYDLSGHDGQLRRCPECGVLRDVDVEFRAVVPRKWLWIGAVSLGLGFAGLLVFYIVLHAHELRLMDLWNNASPLRGVAKPKAATMAGAGRVLVNAISYHATVQLMYSVVLGILAFGRHDKRAFLVALLTSFGTVVYFASAFYVAAIISGM